MSRALHAYVMHPDTLAGIRGSIHPIKPDTNGPKRFRNPTTSKKKPRMHRVRLLQISRIPTTMNAVLTHRLELSRYLRAASGPDMSSPPTATIAFATRSPAGTRQSVQAVSVFHQSLCQNKCAIPALVVCAACKRVRKKLGTIVGKQMPWWLTEAIHEDSDDGKRDANKHEESSS